MNYYIGDYPPNDFDGPRGWICPKCGRVYSPSTSMCWYCGGNTTTTTTPNTNIPPTTTGSIPYKFPDIITSTATIPIHYGVSSFLNNLIDNLEE